MQGKPYISYDRSRHSHFPGAGYHSQLLREIRPGMFARSKVNFGSKERTVVSDRAVVKQTGTNDKYVYVLDGDIVRYTKVEIGKRVGDIYEIKSGLEAGQMVVTAGISRLVDQAKVKVVEGNDMLKQ